MELHPQPRPARPPSRAWDPAPHDPAADPQAQRQGRALPADARPRVGLRAALPRLRRPRGSTAHLAAALQLHPQPQLDLRPAAYQPRSGPAEAQQLGRGASRLVELAAQAQVGGDAAEVLRLLGAVERDADAAASRAAGAPDAVHVALAVGGRVEVDDVRDAVDVDAARGDVGRDERVDRAGLEAGERLLALALGLVAVHGDGRHAGGAEAPHETVGAALRA